MRHQQRIGDAADREARDDQARDRGALFAGLMQHQRDERKQAEDHDAFEEHRPEAHLGARIGEHRAVAGGETAEREPGALGARGRPQCDDGDAERQHAPAP